MGKKGSWLSAIRRVFTPNSSSRDKLITGPENKTSQKKKKERRRLKHGEFKSFIPLFREPSSIEKILGEADEQKLFVPLYSEQQKITSPPRLPPISPRVTSPKTTACRAVFPGHSPPREASPRVASPKHDPVQVCSQQAGSSHVTPPKPISPKAASSKVIQDHRETIYKHRAEPTLQVLHLSATTIQSIFRGYMARKSFRSLRGVLRLQGVVRGNNVKRQTANTMKQMQLFVRVQNQIRLRRIEMLDNQEPQWLAFKNYKDGESTLSKWSIRSEAGDNENWDGSRLSKDQVDQRRRRKVEAVMKRERAMAYAYSHKLWKASPKSTTNNGSNSFPLWWKWLEHPLPSANHSESQSAAKSVNLSPERAISECTPNHLRKATTCRNLYSEYGNLEADTPTSTKSSVPMRAKLFHYTPGRTPQYSSSLGKYAHSGARTAASTSRFPLKDDDSLTSCPPFSVPNYMTPTISAKAKARQREGSVGTPSSHTMRRSSFPLTSNMGSFKWNIGSSKGAASLKECDGSADRMSVNSTVSMPATVGRKPFKRFV
ncbi:unnamed protein product [Cuscuta campestris]|uniref:DUF4005 domain-containing protein n=1 Tax=Cuscuta campestris TaxID=132261 RepID=A0A484MJQ8_9ASTE|nr:unnamed protein product [Cuscuta campestris]